MSFGYNPPRDVFPRRNLGAGEEWGREMEKRVVGTENALGTLSQVLSGGNRTSASSLGDLGRQIQELQELYESIPKVVQNTATSSGFGLVGNWQTVCSGTVEVPEGVSRAEVALFGVVWMKANLGAQTLIQAWSRVVIAGTAGPAFVTAADAFDPGLGATNGPQFSREFAVTPGGSFSIALQVSPANAAAFPAHGDNYAVITALSSFTG